MTPHYTISEDKSAGYPFTHFLVCKNPGERPFTFGFFPSLKDAKRSKDRFKHDVVVIVDVDGKECR